MTLDGKIATRTGDSKWISNEASRRHVHALRGRMDAIIIGFGTALADDPLLTVRPPGPRTPARVVLDSAARLPITSRLATSAREAPVVVVTGKAAPSEKIQELRRLGCEVLTLPGEGRPSVAELLNELGQRRMTNVLVEGGAEVLGSFLDSGAIDEVHVFLAPRLAGGSGAKTPIEGIGVARIAEALPLKEWEVEKVGDNVLIHGTL
jgi:diaminohydroxyphosphoribosylaminopyrimidine deaminase/5-amino-6-(5-phosphoribosylamino)uracil reductase